MACEQVFFSFGRRIATIFPSICSFPERHDRRSLMSLSVSSTHRHLDSEMFLLVVDIYPGSGVHQILGIPILGRFAIHR
jgi:hypothetical protein